MPRNMELIKAGQKNNLPLEEICEGSAQGLARLPDGQFDVVPLHGCPLSPAWGRGTGAVRPGGDACLAPGRSFWGQSNYHNMYIGEKM